MGRTKTRPQKPADAEILLKLNPTIRPTNDEGDLNVALGLAMFANRSGYHFLADYFAWLADRPLNDATSSDADSGQHEHLELDTELSDELPISFDTITEYNREALLENADISLVTRRRGSLLDLLQDVVRGMVKFVRTSPYRTIREPIEQDLERTIEALKVAREEISHG